MHQLVGRRLAAAASDALVTTGLSEPHRAWLSRSPHSPSSRQPAPCSPSSLLVNLVHPVRSFLTNNACTASSCLTKPPPVQSAAQVPRSPQPAARRSSPPQLESRAPADQHSSGAIERALSAGAMAVFHRPCIVRPYLYARRSLARHRAAVTRDKSTARRDHAAEIGRVRPKSTAPPRRRQQKPRARVHKSRRDTTGGLRWRRRGREARLPAETG